MKQLPGCLAILLSGICPLIAQESSPLLRYNPQDTVYLLGENVNLRSDTSIAANVITRLNVGENVVILGRSVLPLTLNERTEHWYKVKSLRLKKEGYVWGGLLSCVTAKEKDLLFLMNKVAVSNSKKMTIEIRAVRENKIQHTIAVPDFPYENHELGEFFLSSEVYNNRGLSDYQNIIRFGSSLETGMCDVIGTNTQLYLLWDGKKMTPLPLIEAWADGCTFGSYYGSAYIFPSDPDGKPDVILQRSQNGECDEEEIEYTRTVSVRKLVWNGKRFILPEPDHPDKD